MRPVHPWMMFAPVTILAAATLEGLILQRTQGHYDWRAYLASLGDLLLRAVMNTLPLSFAAAALNLLWSHRLYTMSMNSAWGWPVLLIGQDFCYYWMHRADHRVRWMWATHSVHHSPNELNLSAAYRLGWTARMSVAPIFFAPLILIGFSPALVGGVLAANLFYQFWLHAPWIPSLGPLEWALNTPAHHRVHHASNPQYLDANFGGVLIIFDRLFGTFLVEQPAIAIRYGLATPLRSHNPIVIGLREWRSIAGDLMRARSPGAVLRAAFGPPPPQMSSRMLAADGAAEATLRKRSSVVEM